MPQATEPMHSGADASQLERENLQAITREKPASHKKIPQAATKTPQAAAKTWHSQKNKEKEITQEC